MTKMHRGKKAAASLMAGILLCQMFVFGVSKTSADAREVAKKMSFEVVGEIGRASCRERVFGYV